MHSAPKVRLNGRRSSVACFSESGGGCLYGFCLLLEPFIAGAAVATVKMRYYGCVANGTSRLHHSVRSLRDLHSHGAFGPRRVNLEETCTS